MYVLWFICKCVCMYVNMHGLCKHWMYVNLTWPIPRDYRKCPIWKTRHAAVWTAWWADNVGSKQGICLTFPSLVPANNKKKNLKLWTMYVCVYMHVWISKYLCTECFIMVIALLFNALLSAFIHSVYRQVLYKSNTRFSIWPITWSCILPSTTKKWIGGKGNLTLC